MAAGKLLRGVIIVMCLAGSAAAGERPLVEPLEPDDDSATSAAVLVGPCALAHTAQMLPIDAAGNLVGENDVAQQIRQVLANLEQSLDAAGSGIEHLVRIHVYAERAEGIAETRKQFREQFPRSARSAVTWTVGELPLAGALVMMDAVAAVPEHDGAAVSHHRVAGVRGSDGRAHVSILPRGRVVYVSGQAAAGGTLAEATRNTLAGLSTTLEHLGLDRSHVVHVKSFLQPMTGVSDADREIAAFFAGREGRPVPATVHVEWTMRSPIEIELIASAPEGTVPQATGRIAAITPPGMQASPIFARVVVIDSERALYTSGLSVPASDAAEREVRDVFDRLGELLELAGSDFRHLAKATYYVADADVSRMLNAVRPDYYDPERPPAASKAEVRGAGPPGARISVDLIAVPAGPAESAEALGRKLLDDALDRAERSRIIEERPHQSAALLRALVADLEPGTPEEYRRIPWIWRVTVAAGRRNRGHEVRRILELSLPRPDEPLRDWQSVVIGGGIVNGISQAGDWPRTRVGELLKDSPALRERWERAIELASAMADDEDVPMGTRYDALRMLGVDTWERRGEQLTRYLKPGVHDELQMGAVSGLADVREPQAVAALLSGIGHYSERNRGLALDGLLRDAARIEALLDAVERGAVRPSDLGEERIRVLRNVEDEPLRARARRLFAPA
ncbi:MAG TPA: Rid family hydrolase [Planctomycetaceae bacterium]|nr:Rid family hydrolase [Planctomycetaceae bacterium]